MHCVKCGSLLAEGTVDGRLRPACPACGWVAYQQLKVGAGVIIQEGRRILLVRRSPKCDAFPGTWSLPAGYCEADERPWEAARREAAEETGLDVVVGTLVDVYAFDDDPRGNGLLLVYEAHAPDPGGAGAAGPDRTEVAEVARFEADQVPDNLCGGGHDRAIRAWQARVQDRWEPGLPMRFCPHCAHSLDEGPAFGLVRPLCPICGYIRFREPKVGVSILAEQAGRVLLVRRAIEPGKGLWGLPSGFVEYNEAPEAAAIRECEEETGLTIGELELVNACPYEDYRGAGINLTYQARIAGGSLRPGDDADAVRFFAASELPPSRAIAFKGHRALLAAWHAQADAGAEGCLSDLHMT